MISQSQALQIYPPPHLSVASADVNWLVARVYFACLHPTSTLQFPSTTTLRRRNWIETMKKIVYGKKRAQSTFKVSQIFAESSPEDAQDVKSKGIRRTKIEELEHAIQQLDVKEETTSVNSPRRSP